jgi:hypothetical protein
MGLGRVFDKGQAFSLVGLTSTSWGGEGCEKKGDHQGMVMASTTRESQYFSI